MILGNFGNARIAKARGSRPGEPQNRFFKTKRKGFPCTWCCEIAQAIVKLGLENLRYFTALANHPRGGCEQSLPMEPNAPPVWCCAAWRNKPAGVAAGV
jgi:hypothetical protein